MAERPQAQRPRSGSLQRVVRRFRIAYAPSAACSTSAILILLIFIIASIARRARFGSGSAISLSKRVGVTCQDTPQRSLSQPHGPSEPPADSAAQSLSTSAWSAQAIWNETASVNGNSGP